MGEDVEGLVGLLSRRHELIDTLSDGARSKSALEAELGVSRSTIDRAVRSLENEGIVERESGGVSLTFPGRVALNGYRRFRSGLVGLERARPVLDSVAAEETPPFGLFQGAEVVTASRKSPHRPVTALGEFLDDADDVRSVATGLMGNYVRLYHSQIIEEGLEAELVIESPILDDLLASHWDPVAEALSTDRLTVYETRNEPAFSVKIGESDTTEVALLTYGAQGVSGFLRTGDERAVSWAEDFYERTRSDATRIAPLE